MSRSLQWILAACVALLALAWPAAAHAATSAPTAPTLSISLDNAASPAAVDRDDATPSRHLDGSPTHDNTPAPADSDALWFDEEDDDDDDCGRERAHALDLPPAFEDALGLRSPSRSPQGPVSTDGSTLATRFLTDSVRRI